MKNTVKRILSIVLAVALFATLGISAFAVSDCCNTEGCTCADTCTGTACQCTACKTPAVTIDKGDSITIANGEVAYPKATYAYPACSGLTETSTITWSVSGDSVSLPTDKVSSNGGIMVITGAKIGTATVTATATGKSYSDSMTVNVVPKAPTATGGGTVNAIVGTKVTLNPKAASSEGTAVPNFGYTWTKPDGTTDSGEKLEVTFEQPGTYVYKCKVSETISGKVGKEKEVTFSVVVKDKYTVTVTSSPAGATSVPTTKTVGLIASVVENKVTNNVFSTAAVTNPTISWNSPNTAKLTVTPVAGNSAYATATGVAISTTPIEVTATYTDTNRKPYIGKYSLKVQNEFVVTLGATDTSVLIGDTSLLAQVQSVYDSSTRTYASNLSTATGYYYEVSYASDNSAVAEVNSTTGVVTAKTRGTAKITATVTVYSSYPANSSKVVAVLTKDCNVTVTDDSFDICANLKSGGTMSFTDAHFSGWFKKKTADSYNLNSVILGTPASSVANSGAFKYSGTAFTPNSIELYAAGRTGSYFIANTSYTAGTGTYYVTVPFTCYGGTTTSDYSVTRSGTLYIFVNPGSVGTITYTMGTAVAKTLAVSDFISVFRTAQNTAASGITTDIKLLDVPENGDLYLGYTSASNPGTKLTASNIGNYSFTASTVAEGFYNIDDVTYVPDTNAAGTETLRYTASVNGTLVYVARLAFDNGDSGIVSYSEGRTFQKTDFYSAAAANPVVSVKFSQPETGKGKLYVNYANGRGTLVSATDSYNTAAATTTKEVTSVTYIPPAGFEGNVSFKVAATTQSGSTEEINFVITVKSKTASSVFTDVTAKNTGSWSANAIDYAYKWGLVNGTTTTAPLKYSPSGNMTRAQFVAILYRAAGSPSTAGIENPFTDIKKTTSTAWYYDAVLWAYHNKIVSGASATTYNPGGKLTREQLSKMLYGFDQYMTGVTPSGGISITDYTDYTKVSSYAVESIKWAVGKGIITSASATAKTINPQGTATRAQVATMLHRYLTK